MGESNAENAQKQTWSLEMFLRKIFKNIIDPIAGFFLKIGLRANVITVIGFALAGLSAYFLASGRFLIGGLVLLVGAPLDVIDGAMARLQGETSKFGALLDSVTDRYAELVVLLGLLIYYLEKGNQLACILVFVAAAGSVMVSYTKARAESLGFTAKVGLLTRVERMIVMIICLLIKQPMIALWIIAIVANATAIQRMLFVHKQAVINK